MKGKRLCGSHVKSVWFTDLNGDLPGGGHKRAVEITTQQWSQETKGLTHPLISETKDLTHPLISRDKGLNTPFDLKRQWA